MPTNHTDIDAHILGLHNVPFRDWAQRVSDTWKLQKRKEELSSCAKCSMRKLEIGNIKDQVLIGEPAEAAKLVLETDDVIDKLFNTIYVEIFSQSYG